MLKMKGECERCHSATPADQPAAICSFECTFCPDCRGELLAICPNCQGELVDRPRRVTSVAAVAASQIRRRLFGGAAR